MKTCLFYGVMMAIANFAFTLILFLLGLHTDASKVAEAQWVGLLGTLAITVTAIILGTRARRAELPAEAGFAYGKALGAGVAITLVSAAVGIVTNYLYVAVINPQFNELLLQNKLDKLSAQGISDAQMAQVERISRMFMTPAVEAISSFIAAFFLGLLISLVTSAILKRAPAGS